jgi:hypothetical protein
VSRVIEDILFCPVMGHGASMWNWNMVALIVLAGCRQQLTFDAECAPIETEARRLVVELQIPESVPIEFRSTRDLIDCSGLIRASCVAWFLDERAARIDVTVGELAYHDQRVILAHELTHVYGCSVLDDCDGDHDNEPLWGRTRRLLVEGSR